MKTSSQVTISIMTGTDKIRLTTIQCSKPLLIKFSGYFKRELKTNCDLITLPYQDKYEVFPLLLRYMQTGEFHLDSEGKFIFAVHLAYQLEISVLLHQCEQKLKHFSINQLRHILRVSSFVLQNDDFVNAVLEELAKRLEDKHNYDAFCHLKYDQILNLLLFPGLNIKIAEKKLPAFIELYLKQREKVFNDRFELRQIVIMKNVVKNLQLLHDLCRNLKESILEPVPNRKISPYQQVKQLREMFYQQLNYTKDLETFEFQYQSMSLSLKKRSQSASGPSVQPQLKPLIKTRARRHSVSIVVQKPKEESSVVISTLETLVEVTGSKLMETSLDPLSSSSTSTLLNSQPKLPSNPNLSVNASKIQSSGSNLSIASSRRGSSQSLSSSGLSINSQASTPPDSASTSPSLKSKELKQCKHSSIDCEKAKLIKRKAKIVQIFS